VESVRRRDPGAFALGGHRYAVENANVAPVEGGGAVDPNAVGSPAVASGNGDIDLGWRDVHELPEPRRRTVADHGAGPARENRAQLTRPWSWNGVADEVHPAVQRVEPGGLEAPIDRVPRQPHRAKLATRYHAELFSSQLGQRVVGSFGALASDREVNPPTDPDAPYVLRSSSLARMPVNELASVDGSISPAAEATIPVADDGLLRGDGVFEMVRLYGGRPFTIGDHLDRLERSASAIELPVDRAAIEREIDALLTEFGDDDAALRVVLTRGGRRLLLTEPLPAHPETIRVATVTYSPSVILTGVKSISYAANMEATRLAQARGADEAILVQPDGIVLEAPTSTVFWISPEGGLRTPALDTGILESITRAQIVRELHVEEGAFQVEDLRAATEAFLASTTREIQPVSAIDGRELPGGPAPQAARAASEAFRRVVERELA
jgi:branched-chain amino acid aminotransferase